jgi:hypothetical protein
MRSKINNLYPCSQPELFSVAHLGWNNCLQNLSAFSKFRKYYSQQVIEKMLSEIENVSMLPGNEFRQKQISEMRNELLMQSHFCLLRWKALKRYLLSAYDEPFHKTKLKGAGIKYYDRAANQKWIHMDSLMRSGSQFIDRNYLQLTKDHNMPISFIAEFEQSFREFRSLYMKFLALKLNTFTETSNYIISCNKIHKVLMSMLLDAQCIFNQNKILKKQFTFTLLLKEVRKNNVAIEKCSASEINIKSEFNNFQNSSITFPVRLNVELTEEIFSIPLSLWKSECLNENLHHTFILLSFVHSFMQPQS